MTREQAAQFHQSRGASRHARLL